MRVKRSEVATETMVTPLPMLESRLLFPDSYDGIPRGEMTSERFKVVMISSA